MTETEGSFVLEKMARYKITLPKDSIQDGAGNTGPSSDFSFEFVTGDFETYAETGIPTFDPAMKIIRALPTSTAEKLDFSVLLPIFPREREIVGGNVEL